MSFFFFLLSVLGPRGEAGTCAVDSGLSLLNTYCISNTSEPCAFDPGTGTGGGRYGDGQYQLVTARDSQSGSLITFCFMRVCPNYAGGGNWEFMKSHYWEQCGSTLTGLGGYSAGRGGVGAGAGACATRKPGSIINIDNQILMEKIPVVGTGFDLLYSSERSIGHFESFQVHFPITTDLRPEVSSVTLRIYNEIDSEIESMTFSNLTENMSYDFTASGLDAFGGIPLGTLRYRAVITEARTGYSIPVESILNIGVFNAKLIGLGGWVPSIWHFYDPSSKILHRGDGSIRRVDGQAIPTGYRVAEEGGELVYEFDSVGRILSTRTGVTGQQIYSFAYVAGKLASITSFPGTLVTTFSYDSLGRLNAILAPRGQVTVATIDNNGYLASISNPANETYAMTYRGGTGLLETFGKPNGTVSTFEYDAQGLLRKDSHSGGFFAELVRLTQTIDGKSQRYRSKMGRTTTVYHDRTVSRTIHPNGKETWSSLSSYSSQVVNQQVSYSYGWTAHPRFGSMAKLYNSATLNDGNVTSGISRTENVTLSDPANPFSIASWTVQERANVREVNSSYEPIARTWTMQSKLGKTSSWQMDMYERTTKTQRGNLTPVEYIYSDDQLTRIAQGARAATFRYCPRGLLISRTNALQQTTGFVYDSAERLRGIFLPDLRAITLDYNQIGQVTGITPFLRPQHIFSFNASELPSGYQPPPLAGVSIVGTSYGYNDDKQLIQIVRPDGGTIDFSYATTSGFLQTMTTPSGIYTYQINNSNEKISDIVGPTGLRVSRLFSGNYLTSSTLKTSQQTFWQYDTDYHSKFGKKIQDRIYANSSSASMSYSYNDDADLVSAGTLSLSYSYPNGLMTGSNQGSATDSYTYNSFGEVDSYTAKFGGITLYSYNLARDLLGRIVSKSIFSDGAGSTVDEYTFDGSGRLVEVMRDMAAIAKYGYDVNGNRNSGVVDGVATSAVYDSQDRMLSYGVFEYAYNANGDLLSKTNSLTAATTSYVYDVLGNLMSVTLPSGDVVSYEVDGFNRRVGRKVNGTLVRRYIYMDQIHIIAELDATTGKIARQYVYGSKQNIPDYFIEGGDEYRIFSDHLGSPRIIIRISDGVIVQKMDHDEFGRVRVDTNPGYTPFGFAGGIYDSYTGLVRFGARDYDPMTGRWTSKDPIMFEGGDTNLYGYVLNDPVNLIDPMGTDWTDAGFAMTDAAAGFSDMASFGLSSTLMDNFSGGGGVNKCSGAYRGGQAGALAVSVGRLAYAGLAKGAAMMSSPQAAVAARNSLKFIFRGGLWSGRMYSYEAMLAKYGSAAGAGAAAGRTNAGANAWAAGAAASYGGQCGCE